MHLDKVFCKVFNWHAWSDVIAYTLRSKTIVDKLEDSPLTWRKDTDNKHSCLALVQ